jgi:citrate lyase subunit beta/citryl-CoA lyase
MNRNESADIPVRSSRSVLFVPASNWSMIEKAVKSVADAVCIDLEDSVSSDQKAISRANVIRALTQLDFGARTRMVRINGLETPYAYRDLIEVVEVAGDHLDLIMIPKVASAGDVIFVDRLLGQIEVHRGLRRRIGLEAQIETASGFVWLREISTASRRLEALIFGPGDYAASMHMPTSAIGAVDSTDDAYPGHRWHAAMHGIVAAARANGLRCVDGPFAAFRDDAGFSRACQIARAMGFDGKQCIHPAQLPIANHTFSPTDEELAHARRVVAACEAAIARGQAAASLDDTMIDTASVRIARVVLEQHRRLHHT